MFYRSHPWLSVQCYLYQRYDRRFSKYVVVCIMTNNIQSTVGCSDSGSGLYSGGLTWSIVLRCDDHTGIFTCDGCARDPYFYVPAKTQSYIAQGKSLPPAGINLGTFGLQRP